MNGDPLGIFNAWYEEAWTDPPSRRDVIALATATPRGRPSVRMVFFRGLREGGFSFFTNYESRKGREIRDNPFGAIVFHWPHVGRQVRIEGSIHRLSADESDRYFESRSFESQVTASVSRQSRPLSDEGAFLEDLRRAEGLHRGQPIARPNTWGGFRLEPSCFEFWSRGDHRRHERLAYETHRGKWLAVRLYP